jgi:host factor-I protein
MNKNNLQKHFLQELCKNKVTVAIFLVNGIKLHGIITDCEEQVIMLHSTVTQMVYKHAISTVVPVRNITN